MEGRTLGVTSQNSISRLVTSILTKVRGVANGPGWPAEGHLPILGRSGRASDFRSWLREIFHCPVGHFSRQVSSLSACWECFENRDKVIIVLKRSLKEDFWKVSPNILFSWLMGSVQGFFQMTDGLHQRLPLFILTLTEEKKMSQSQTRPLMQCDFVLVLWKEEKCCEKTGPAFGDSDSQLRFLMAVRA